ncbi:MAG: UDP-N-acetylglucosamine 2-epimerase (non-hydrolyzing) [Candidatus Acidiferrum sp.]|jgi:UDP-N-acetylglucosamine 2-epimerase
MPSDSSRNGGSSLKLLSIVGARPQFVKLAPICRAIETQNTRRDCVQIEHRVVHTGQHYEPEVADIFFVQMSIPAPDYNLAVGSGAPGVQLGKMLERLDPVLSSERPDWVLVYGDTNSTLAGALLAARMKLPLAHVEAGCRSGDLSMPEEQNRILTDHLSQLLFAPSQMALRNLEHEGFSLGGDVFARRVVFTGDVTYDALLGNLQLAEAGATRVLADLGLRNGQYYLLTLHRAANTDHADTLRSIVEAVQHLDLPVLFPVHPRTRNVLSSEQIRLGGNIRPIAPLGYLEMLGLERHACKILTDSGGVQKEAFYLGVPCITLREETEWPETVDLGANRITGTTFGKIREAAASEYPRNWLDARPYGSGDAATKILQELITCACGTLVC